ncbi:hypothetical protein QTL95_21585 [Rhizobium sp. S152]|uniref:hypothetical protein n=1 Tax=Rhizobium sp. S152 TaxID=3055038 RepID=UPI0025A9E3E5|nr:hypothetical protein [Rhizobium sp. S152]MDM9628493.1 hypothetical protein [Rhizobium sp. S152]
METLFPRAFKAFQRAAPIVSVAISFYTVAIFLTAAVLFIITTCLLFADQIRELWLLAFDFILSMLRWFVTWFLSWLVWISSILAILGLATLGWGLWTFIDGIRTENRERMLNGLKSSKALLFYSVYAGIVCLLIRGQTVPDLETTHALYWIETWTFGAFVGMILIMQKIMREKGERIFASKPFL